MATRKTFEATARILSEALASYGADATARGLVLRIAEEFADEYARQNSRFDRTRFMRACGLG